MIPVRAGTRPSVSRLSRVTANLHVHFIWSRALSIRECFFGCGTGVGTGTVTMVVVGGEVVVVVVVTVVVEVVVVTGDVLTCTPAPQCQSPFVLHTVTMTLVGVVFVERVKLTPSVCGSTALPASKLLWVEPSQESQTSVVPPEQFTSHTSPYSRMLDDDHSTWPLNPPQLSRGATVADDDAEAAPVNASSAPTRAASAGAATIPKRRSVFPITADHVAERTGFAQAPLISLRR